jgi:hypothetical protein
MKVLESIALLERMAKEAGSTLEKAILMVKVYEQARETEQNDRRSQPHEKDLLRAELAKLDNVALRNNNSREIAAKLVENGVAIRPNVQGVLAFISRQRKQLLLTHNQPQAEAAE